MALIKKNWLSLCSEWSANDIRFFAFDSDSDSDSEMAIVFSDDSHDAEHHSWICQNWMKHQWN